MTNACLLMILLTAEAAFERQDYRGTRELLRQGGTMARDLPEDAAERVRLANGWGALELVEGRLTAAEGYFSRVVRALPRGRQDEDLAAALHNLASVEMQTGRFRAARRHEEEALELWRKALGDQHPNVAKAWVGRSSLEGLAGDWKEAERCIRKALAIAETPEALSNYAAVLDHLKRGREAQRIRKGLSGGTVKASGLVDVQAFGHEKEGVMVRAR